MKKNIFIFIGIIVLILVIFTFWVFSRSKNQCKIIGDPNSQIVLYFRDDCPHCKKVEEFIKSNEADKKITFAQKEVGLCQSNAKDLLNKSQQCGIPQNQLGVPLLWDGSKCIEGDGDIISFFQQKLNEIK